MNGFTYLDVRWKNRFEIVCQIVLVALLTTAQNEGTVTWHRVATGMPCMNRRTGRVVQPHIQCALNGTVPCDTVQDVSFVVFALLCVGKT